MTNTQKVKCDYCRLDFFKENRRVNEAKKMGWRVYCSDECQSKAKNHQHVLTCSRSGCSKLFTIKNNQYKLSTKHYCSLRCSSVVNNSNFPKRLIKIKICSVCNKKYFGDATKYCSTVCKNTASTITKEEIVKWIRSFYDQNGRIPLKREYVHCKAARLRFGTWNNAVSSAGYEPNQVLFTRKFTALDGHKCDSLAEKIIDDWLFKNKITHHRSIYYPNQTRLKTDFVVNNYWIEFFGLSGQVKRYDELKEEKLKLIKELNLPFIALYPDDIFPVSILDWKLGLVMKLN